VGEKGWTRTCPLIQKGEAELGGKSQSRMNDTHRHYGLAQY